MAEMGKMVREMEIKSSGDMFFQLNAKTPQNLTKIAPTKVKSCEVLQGEPGTVGCVTKWIYDNGGIIATGKETISAIDDKKRIIKYKFLEGDILKQFKTFESTLQVNTVGTKDLVTLTFEYQKINDGVEDPIHVMNFYMDLTKDIDIYHLSNSTQA